MKCIAGFRSGLVGLFVDAKDPCVLTEKRRDAKVFGSVNEAVRGLFHFTKRDDEEPFVIQFGRAETVRFTCSFCLNEAAHRVHRMHEALVCETCASELKLKHLEPIK